MIAVTCTSCQKKLSVKDEFAGKKGKCPGCGAPVVVPSQQATDQTLPPRAPSGEPDQGAQPSAVHAAANGEAGGAQGSDHPAELTNFLAPAQAADELGRLGPYRVLAILGHGGMGVVYRAEDPGLQRLVALKAMLPSLPGNLAAKDRFFREARAAAALKHPHIVSIYYVGEDGGVPFLTMEYLEGESLDSRLEREGKQPLAETLRIGREVAEGLTAAHAKGLIHRDIKPANIWLENVPEAPRGRVKILDFGVARSMADQSKLTQSGAIIGTPAYMSPEQASGKGVDHRCDLFSLGCVLYCMATGEMPFKGDSTIAVLSALANDTPTPPRELHKAIPQPLSDFIMQLLAKQPEQRPQSAQVVVDTLREIEHRTEQLPRSTTNFPAGPPSRVSPAEQYSFLLPPVESDEIGRLGNYRVLRLLGTGGMGMVFHAEDIALRRPVALKVMRPDEEEKGARSWQRFLREARAMAAIKHDHLVTVYQVGQEGETIYLAMELLQGQPLDQWIEGSGPDDVSQILRIGEEIAVGLSAIHEHGLVHRDIKPANIWLESIARRPSSVGNTMDNGPRTDFRVKILDFGLAREATEETKLTEPGMLVGTPAFLSPEQARGRPADARSDLFSFGCVLYCMCTRQLPFEGKNALDQLAALASDEPAPVKELNGSIPEELSDLVAELLAKDPADRPQSAAEVAERLLKIMRSLTVRVRQKTSAQERPPRKAEKERPARVRGSRDSWLHNPWAKVALMAGSFIAALAVIGIFFLAFSPGGHKQKDKDTPVVERPAVNDKFVPEKPPPGKQPLLDKQFLSEMPKEETVNWPFHKNKEGKKPPPELSGPISVKGQPSPHGIFMHPAPPFDLPASITVRLDQRYRTLTGGAALNDSSPVSPSTLTFAVYGDGKLLWKSRDIDNQNQSQKFYVPVDGVNMLKLEVTASGDVRKAHAVWVEPKVEK